MENLGYRYESSETIPASAEVVNSASTATSKTPARQLAVDVKNASKAYGKNQVLKDLNMSVPQNSIYSLLGSSGCGKTTILSSIVGIKSLNSGEIRVFGRVPGSAKSGIPGKCVGHMPQEYALHNEFSIKESFLYYGRIYSMTSEDIDKRANYLINYLNLPKHSQKIHTLSGGQKRRVSLAMALIHEPKLLILDEPTVGVDQLLRENIWRLLRQLVDNAGTTVIITTHYIEETRASDVIGVMRNGRLLVEKNPQRLLESHGKTHLEDVVFHLSQMDENQQLPKITTLNSKFQNSSKIFGDHFEVGVESDDAKKSIEEKKDFEEIVKTPPISFHRFKALVAKNFIVLFRNLLFLLFTFISPALQILVVCLAVGRDPMDLKFGIINFENPGNCMETLTEFNNWNVSDEDSDCRPANWSCVFIDSLPKTGALDLMFLESEEAGLGLVERGSLWGYLSIPENFSENLFHRYLEGLNPSQESLRGSTINFRMDLSSQSIAVSLERTMLDSFQKFSNRLLNHCNFAPEAAGVPLKLDEPVYGSRQTDFREWIAPSILLGIMFFFPLCSSSVTYIGDNKAGTLDRSLVAGVTHLEIIISHLLSQGLILVGQALLAFLILTQLFHIAVQGSVASALFLTLLVGVAGMSMGFLISTFAKEEIEAVLIAMGTFFPNFLLAGMVWPVEGMVLFLQYLGYLLPCTLACESMRSIISRGWGIFHPKVWPGFASTIAWILLYWTLAILIFRLARR